MIENKFIILPGNNSTVVAQQLVRFKDFKQQHINEADIKETKDIAFIWKPTNFSLKFYQHLATLNVQPTLINHFEFNNQLTTKNGIVTSLKAYYQQNTQAKYNNYTIWDTMPNSYILSTDFDSPDFRHFEKAYRLIKKNLFYKDMINKKHCQDNLWILKPVNLNQGRGIEIFQSLKGIKLYLSQKPIYSLYIVQKYIEKPLLYRKRKFDIRVWVLLTQNYEIFMYKHGYLRTSSEIYTTENQKSNIHLTNNCLQKNLDNFGQFEDGNTLSFQAFQEYLSIHHHKVNIERDFRPRMKDLIIDSLLSVQNTINTNNVKNCFELFGYDFMIDEDYRTWLIEANCNPYIGCSNQFMKQMVPQMIHDMCKILIKPHEYKDNNYNNNAFEIIYNQKINQRRPFEKHIIWPLGPPVQNEIVIKNGIDQDVKKQEIFKSLMKDKYLQLKKIQETYPYQDFEPYTIHVSQIVKQFKCYYMFQTEDKEYFLKILNFIQKFKILDIFYEQSFQNQLSSLMKNLNNELVKNELKFELINIIQILIKNSNGYKLCIKNSFILYKLIQFIVSENQEQQKQIVAQIIISVYEYSVQSTIIPGQRREKELLKQQLNKFGIFLVIFYINQIQMVTFNYDQIKRSLNSIDFDSIKQSFERLSQKIFESDDDIWIYKIIQLLDQTDISNQINELSIQKKNLESIQQKLKIQNEKNEKQKKNEQQEKLEQSMDKKNNKYQDKYLQNNSQYESTQERQQVVQQKFREWEQNKLKEIQKQNDLKIQQEKLRLQQQEEQQEMKRIKLQQIIERQKKLWEQKEKEKLKQQIENDNQFYDHELRQKIINNCKTKQYNEMIRKNNKYNKRHVSECEENAQKLPYLIKKKYILKRVNISESFVEKKEQLLKAYFNSQEKNKFISQILNKNSLMDI